MGKLSATLTSAGIFNIFKQILTFTGAQLMDEASGLENILAIVTKPDNIPIVGMLILVIFFTWLGLREGFKHDKLIEEGKEDEIPHEMWK